MLQLRDVILSAFASQSGSRDKTRRRSCAKLCANGTPSFCCEGRSRMTIPEHRERNRKYVAMPSAVYSVELELAPPPGLAERARSACGENPHTRLNAICNLRDIIYTSDGVDTRVKAFSNINRGTCASARRAALSPSLNLFHKCEMSVTNIEEHPCSTTKDRDVQWMGWQRDRYGKPTAELELESKTESKLNSRTNLALEPRSKAMEPNTELETGFRARRVHAPPRGRRVLGTLPTRQEFRSGACSQIVLRVGPLVLDVVFAWLMMVNHRRLIELVNYYKFKQENPKFYEGVYPLDLRQIGDENIVAVPPYRDQEGRRLLIYRIGKEI
ncbi:hypothetical protein EVAR_3300_1 [Eumeta japonica]|uniref:Uncharacterized protein n=1 Tax=Eumeta variegata TaxID=151549 RepID=A0A4C1SVW8_EUMVA|nr:hypothetical protein EVAR_3300_1 [Eumeta japonica]